MSEKKLYALTDDVVRYIGQGLQARASGFRANGDVERAAHVRSIMDALTPLDTDDAVEAALQAWTNPPGPDPFYHEAVKDGIRRIMPLLGKALDRAKREQL